MHVQVRDWAQVSDGFMDSLEASGFVIQPSRSVTPWSYIKTTCPPVVHFVRTHHDGKEHQTGEGAEDKSKSCHLLPHATIFCLSVPDVSYVHTRRAYRAPDLGRPLDPKSVNDPVISFSLSARKSRQPDLQAVT